MPRCDFPPSSCPFSTVLFGRCYSPADVILFRFDRRRSKDGAAKSCGLTLELVTLAREAVVAKPAWVRLISPPPLGLSVPSYLRSRLQAPLDCSGRRRADQRRGEVGELAVAGAAARGLLDGRARAPQPAPSIARTAPPPLSLSRIPALRAPVRSAAGDEPRAASQDMGKAEEAFKMCTDAISFLQVAGGGGGATAVRARAGQAGGRRGVTRRGCGCAEPGWGMPGRGGMAALLPGYGSRGVGLGARTGHAFAERWQGGCRWEGACACACACACAR